MKQILLSLLLSREIWTFFLAFIIAILNWMAPNVPQEIITTAQTFILAVVAFLAGATAKQQIDNARQ